MLQKTLELLARRYIGLLLLGRYVHRDLLLAPRKNARTVTACLLLIIFQCKWARARACLSLGEQQHQSQGGIVLPAGVGPVQDRAVAAAAFLPLAAHAVRAALQKNDALELGQHSFCVVKMPILRVEK